MGIWKDEHMEILARIARFIERQGAVAGIQTGACRPQSQHARPWDGGGVIPRGRGRLAAGGAQPHSVPSGRSGAREELTKAEIAGVVEAFAAAARRALQAGFQVLEIHAAHGYLIHEFLSPLSNRRSDEYGGAFENRIRIALEVVAAVRAAWPEHLPLFLRISATDWVEGGWDIERFGGAGAAPAALWAWT